MVILDDFVCSYNYNRCSREEEEEEEEEKKRKG